jgi:hypothetical protein
VVREIKAWNKLVRAAFIGARARACDEKKTISPFTSVHGSHCGAVSIE